MSLDVAGPTWRERARSTLTNRPSARARLTELGVEPERRIACTLPWTRLELSTSGFAGPCCSDYQAAPASFARPVDVDELWNGEPMRAFRRALADARPEKTCRPTCPVLSGRRYPLADLTLRGGSAPFVEHQLDVAEDLLSGSDLVRGGPLDLLFPPTTFCNYDCLMCEWGELGTLDDELPPAFYESLAPLLPTMSSIEVAGGEPLASPAFRDFLGTLDFDSAPDLRVSLVTNGSYLTPRELERLGRVPFSTITVSLNAATPETYRAVNRGLPYERVRAHLDELLSRQRDGRLRGNVAYSMVLLRTNVHEISAFGELARRDRVNVRFMLPMFDRNGQSIMTDAALMRAALDALEAEAATEEGRGQPERARGIRGEAAVLRDRLAKGVLEPLPDGRAAPDARRLDVVSA